MIWIWRNPKTLPQKRMGEYIQDTGTDRFEFRKAIGLDKGSVVAPNLHLFLTGFIIGTKRLPDKTR